MASQSAPITESIQFPATQNLQPGPSDHGPDQQPEPVSEEVPHVGCREPDPDEPSEVILTYREFEEIKDCSQAICDSIKLFRETTLQMGDQPELTSTVRGCPSGPR